MATAVTPTAAASARSLTYASYVSFLPIGIATVLLGPMLPTLSVQWSLNYAQAGALFNAQYLASTCAVALSGVVVARWGYRVAINVGLLLMAVGVAFLLSGSKTLGVLCIGAYGGGLGLAVPAANLLVAAANPQRRSATLNLLNFFWSAGAVACPFLVAAAVKTGHIQLFLLSVAATAVGMALGISFMRNTVAEPTPVRSKAPVLGIIRSRSRQFAILAGLFFFYVGVENGFGQWMATYAKSQGTLLLAVALETPSLFYASLMVGRWFAPTLLRFLDEVNLVRSGLLLACVGMTGLIFSRQLPGIAASAVAAGFGLSAVYPITISLLSRESDSAKIGSMMFVLSNIGGGLLPWIVGVSSTRFGTLKAGLYVPLLGCLAMYLLYAQNWTPLRSGQQSPSLPGG